jgi:hypothetical protein
VVVDTSLKPLRRYGDGDVEVGYNKHFYYLCTVVFGRRYHRELFLLYPDQRSAKQTTDEARAILNRGAYAWGDWRVGPYRRLEYASPKKCQALQVVDIFIGALASKLNGHHDRAEARPEKKELSDYIWDTCKLPDPNQFKTTSRQQWKLMTWLRRPTPEDAPRVGPNNWS